MTALADFRSRIQILLTNDLTADYSDNRIDEALKQALSQYNGALPYEKDTVIVLPGDGREIALNSVTGLRHVTEVYWPFDSLAEPWPPNQVRGWYLYWDDGSPVLYLNQIEGNEPQQDDELRLWFTAYHTIDGLASETETTIPTEHESLLCKGASGYAAMSRIAYLTESAYSDMFGAGLLATWGSRQIRSFEQELEAIKRSHSRRGQPFTQGWKMDKWDR